MKTLRAAGTIVFFILFLSSPNFAQESMIITSYFPSPYGSYNQVTVMDRQAIGDLTADGNVDQADMAVDALGNPLPGSLTVASRVGIGTINPKGTLDVNGSIFQHGVSLHADYVFDPGYKLESIEKHAKYMWGNRHLTAIPEATHDKTGQEIIDIGMNNKGMLEELEKAHIYIQQLNDKIKVLEQKIEAMGKEK